jgi:hypothetical protein
MVDGWNNMYSTYLVQGLFINNYGISVVNGGRCRADAVGRQQ